MVLFGHVGVTLGGGWLVQAASGSSNRLARVLPNVARALRQGLDLRWLMVGSMLPDIVDKPMIFLAPDSAFGSGRTVAHTLLFVIVLLVAALLARGKPRAVLVTLGVASLGHVALDSMWRFPHTWLWPAMGWRFQELNVGPLAEHVLNELKTDPSVYIPEAIGAVVVLSFAVYLIAGRRARGFIATGKA